MYMYVCYFIYTINLLYYIYVVLIVSLGMRHDGPMADNNCDPGSYLMSPTLGSGKITWSSCSRQYLQQFLQYVKTTNYFWFKICKNYLSFDHFLGHSKAKHAHLSFSHNKWYCWSFVFLKSIKEIFITDADPDYVNHVSICDRFWIVLLSFSGIWKYIIKFIIEWHSKYWKYISIIHLLTNVCLNFFSLGVNYLLLYQLLFVFMFLYKIKYWSKNFLSTAISVALIGSIWHPFGTDFEVMKFVIFQENFTFNMIIV